MFSSWYVLLKRKWKLALKQTNFYINLIPIETNEKSLLASKKDRCIIDFKAF